MNDVVVIGLGSAGDVHPMAGLARALSLRGHRTLLAAPVVFADLARRMDLDFAGLGTEEYYNEALQDPNLWHPYRSFPVVCKRLILPMMRPLYEILARHAGSGRTVFVAPSTALAARIASEKFGVQLATIHLQPSLLRSIHESPVFGFPDLLGSLPKPLKQLYLKAVDKFLIDRLLAPRMNAFRAEIGLPPAFRIFDRWMHSEHLVLGFFPEWFAPPQPDWPPNVHLVGFPLFDERGTRDTPPELQEFLNSGEPPIIFTAGSANVQAREFFRVSVEVCRAGGYRGILLTQFPEVLPQESCEGVRHFEYVPFSEVFPQSRAVVHHGGIGTVAQALAAAVPQLIVPNTHDQPDNAVRVRRLGVGSMLLPRQYRAPAVLECLKRLLDSPAVLENCRARARDIANTNALDKACLLIEQLTPR